MNSNVKFRSSDESWWSFTVFLVYFLCKQVCIEYLSTVCCYLQVCWATGVVLLVSKCWLLFSIVAGTFAGFAEGVSVLAPLRLWITAFTAYWRLVSCLWLWISCLGVYKRVCLFVDTELLFVRLHTLLVRALKQSL